MVNVTLPETRTVLLVDDQKFVGMAVMRLLGGEPDLRLECCEVATDALARANDLDPHLILQDLVMPDLDGMSLVRMYRANPKTARTPIVVLSGNDDDATRTRALDAGANDYLVKLPPAAEFLSCVRRQLSGSGTPAPHRAAPAQDDAIAVLFDRFLIEIKADLDALQDASGRRDSVAMSTIAHRMKGAAGIVGARPLALLCERLEQDQVSILVTAIAREVSRVGEAHARPRQFETIS